MFVDATLIPVRELEPGWRASPYPSPTPPVRGFRVVAVGVPLDDGERVAVMAFLPDRARNLQLCFARLRDAVQTSRKDISCAQAAEFWVLRPEQTHAERKTVKNPFGPGGLGPG